MQAPLLCNFLTGNLLQNRSVFFFLIVFFLSSELLVGKDLWPWPMAHGNALNVEFPSLDRIRLESVYLEGSLFVVLGLLGKNGKLSSVAMQVDTASNACLLRKEYLDEFAISIQDGDFLDATVGQVTQERVNLVTISEARLGPVRIKPFHLITNSLAGLRSSIESNGLTLPVVGILGSNVLFRRSLHIFLAENCIEWTKPNSLAQFDVTDLTEPGERAGMGPVYAVPLTTEEGALAILDTGAYSSLEPLSRTRRMKAQFPKSWMSQNNGDSTWDYGIRATRAILGQKLTGTWSIGIETVEKPTWGTQILSQFDLWFDLADEDHPRLFSRAVTQDISFLDPKQRNMPEGFALLEQPN